MRQFNETEKQIVKGLQSAKYSYSQITKVIDLIKWYAGNGEKVISGNVDPKEFTIKFSTNHKYTIQKEV